MQLTAELISKGFSLQDASIYDLGTYIKIKRVCYNFAVVYNGQVL